MIFIKYYLEGHTLHLCALSTIIDYKHTAVNWASYIRELFCQFVFDTYNMMNFEGEVEMDESLFLGGRGNIIKDSLVAIAYGYLESLNVLLTK